MQNWLSVMQVIHERFTRSGARQARRLQFEGRTLAEGSVFCGEAFINGQRWNMLQVSGAHAHETLGLIARENIPMRCKRIDLQVTIPIDLEQYDALATYNSCDTTSKLLMLNESDGTATIYLGQRTSRKYARLYVKRLYSDYLRLEYEFKRDYARIIYDNILLHGAVVCDDIFQGALDKSHYPTWVKQQFSISENGVKPSQLTPIEELHATEGYWDYLSNVKQSIIRSLEDDTRAARVTAWVKNLNTIVDNTIL